MRVTIKPPNQTLYNERCKAARDCFQHVDIMPPFLVTYMCFSVAQRWLRRSLPPSAATRNRREGDDGE